MVILVVTFCFFYWVGAAVFDSMVFSSSGLFNGLFLPGPYQLIMRLVGVGTIMLFGTIAAGILKGAKAPRKVNGTPTVPAGNFSMFELVGLCVCVCDFSGRITYCNQRFAAVSGYRPKQLHNKYIWELFSDQDRKTIEAAFKNHKIQTATEEHQYQLRTKNGEYRLVKWFTYTFSSREAKPDSMVWSGFDLSEYQQIGQVSRQSESAYQDIIDNIGIGIALVSSDARRIYTNKQMRQWFSFSETSTQSICHNIFLNFSPEMCSECPTCQTLKDGTVNTALMKTSRNGDAVVYKVVTFPIKDKDGATVAAIEMIEDYTKISRQEEQIRRNYLVQAVMNSLLRFSLENISLEGFLDCALNIILSTPWFSPVSMGAVYLVQEDPTALVLKVHNNLPKEIVSRYSRIPFGQGVCGQAAVSGILQFQGGTVETGAVGRDAFSSYGHYCVPVAYANRIVGVIDVYLRPGHARNKREEEFLNAAANTVAGVVQRKRNEERVAKINEGFINLGAEPLQNIQRLVNLCNAILGADLVVYNRLNQQHNAVFSAGRFRFSPDESGWQRSCQELCSALAKHQPQELFVLDTLVQIIPQKTKGTQGHVDFQTCMGQAVKNQGELIGTIVAFYSRRFTPGDDDKKLLGIIVSALGTEEERIKANQQLQQAYDELKKTQHSLVQTEKLAALGRFSSGIAHEVKNPLGIILGGIEFLEQKLTHLDKEAALAAKKIKEATLRADGILRNLLKFAMPSELKTETVGVKELVNDTIAFFKYRASLVNVDIITDFPKEDISIEADTNQMQQVLFNLLMNANEAISERGQIKVRIYKALPDEILQVKAACVIEITDTGSGIPPEHISRLFEPFFTTKREKKGTGLGLAISKMIIENHGGTLTLDSVLSKGTMAKVVLPLADNSRK